MGLTKNHDIPSLWKLARLPCLSKDNNHLRLKHYKSILEWQGRYPVPKNKRIFSEESEGLKGPLVSKHGDLEIRRRIILDWTSFDQLYQIANQQFNDL